VRARRGEKGELNQKPDDAYFGGGRETRISPHVGEENS